MFRAESLNGRFWRIVLKNSFWADVRKFLEPLMRLTCGDVGDHINSSEIDHRASAVALASDAAAEMC
jgi:hypothetical protein